MDNSEEIDLLEQFVRLSARVAELEERVALLENRDGGSREVPDGVTGAPGSPPPDGDTLLAGLRVVLERLGEAEAAEIRQELVKNGFPATLTRSDINKALYRHSAIFEKINTDSGKPEWRLIQGKSG
jgi:hypothetical protein